MRACLYTCCSSTSCNEPMSPPGSMHNKLPMHYSVKQELWLIVRRL